MTTQELRIGNFLHYAGTNYVAKVDLIHGRNHFDCRDESGSFTPNGSYSPIPLTEQWLLDFTEDGEPLCFEKWNDNAWEFYTTTGDFTVNPERIKYVHLFQNWFRFTSGTELTFKTEG